MVMVHDLLTEERKKHNLRQQDVAKRVGRPQSWVARTENGHRRIEVVEFCQLAQAIGFDAASALKVICPKPRKKRRDHAGGG